MTRRGVTGGPAVFPQTKFHRPQVRDEHVERSRLLDAIASSGARIVIVTAPAGFGKCTLLAQWAARRERVAWVPLDADDRGARLWAAVLTALGDLLGRPGRGAGRRGGPRRRPARGVLIALLDALAAAPAPTLCSTTCTSCPRSPGRTRRSTGTWRACRSRTRC